MTDPIGRVNHDRGGWISGPMLSDPADRQARQRDVQRRLDDLGATLFREVKKINEQYEAELITSAEWSVTLREMVETFAGDRRIILAMLSDEAGK